MMPGPKKIDMRDDPRTIWILDRLRRAMLYGAGGIELTAIFDEGMEFLADFAEKFPGRVPDGNYSRAKERAYRHLCVMEKSGFVKRSILANYDCARHEPKWTSEWRVTSRGIQFLRDKTNA